MSVVNEIIVFKAGSVGAAISSNYANVSKVFFFLLLMMSRGVRLIFHTSLSWFFIWNQLKMDINEVKMSKSLFYIVWLCNQIDWWNSFGIIWTQQYTGCRRWWWCVYVCVMVLVGGVIVVVVGVELLITIFTIAFTF